MDWRKVIIDAVMDHLKGDSKNLDRIAKYIEKGEEAKQLLHNAGFGCTGRPLLDTVQDVIDYTEKIKPTQTSSKVGL